MKLLSPEMKATQPKASWSDIFDFLLNASIKHISFSIPENVYITWLVGMLGLGTPSLYPVALQGSRRCDDCPLCISWKTFKIHSDVWNLSMYGKKNLPLSLSFFSLKWHYCLAFLSKHFFSCLILLSSVSCLRVSRWMFRSLEQWERGRIWAEDLPHP